MALKFTNIAVEVLEKKNLTKAKKLKKQFFILKIVSKMYIISDVAVLHKHLLTFLTLTINKKILQIVLEKLRSFRNFEYPRLAKLTLFK